MTDTNNMHSVKKRKTNSSTKNIIFNPAGPPPFDSVGLFTYLRTYARRHDENDPNSTIESWQECLTRVVLATNTQLNCGFTEDELHELFGLLYNLKCSVAGRFLWQLGTRTVDRMGLMSLQNCAAVKVTEPVEPFVWVMNFLMLGAGCGYSILPEDIDKLPVVKHALITRKETNDADFIVPDSREGWCKLLSRVLKAHFYSGKGFTYSCILLRSKGAPIKSFGGTASGPDVLCEGMMTISTILNKRADQKMRSIDALDIMNIIGKIVVSGNVRRCLPGDAMVHCLQDSEYYTDRYIENGTEVRTIQKSNRIPIKHIEVGTEVQTSKGYYKVVNKFYQGKQKLLLIIHEADQFRCTANHKMAVFYNNEKHWIEAGNLDPNIHALIGENNKYYKIFYIVEVEDLEETWDIEVEDVHEFFCDGVLTHNSAQLALGSCKDTEYLRAKRWDLGNVPNYRCYSNNSVICNDIEEILNNEEFWQGYNGNGEPYGLVNMKLSKSCGRLGETQYPDPDVVAYNPCITGDSWILTSEGPRQVTEILGKQINVIVDGKEYSTTEKGFYHTGYKKVYKLTTKEGYELKATDNHQIMTYGGDWVELGKLKIGEKIMLHDHNTNFEWTGEGTWDEGYLLGQLIGDGTFAKGRAIISSWGKNSEIPREKMQKIVMSMNHSSTFKVWTHIPERDEYRLKFNSLTNLAAKFGIFQGNKTITPDIEKASYKFYQGFLSGFFDADGSVQGTIKNGYTIRLIQSNYPLLVIVQRMLCRMGIKGRIYIRRPKRTTLLPSSDRTIYKNYECKSNYEIIISNTSMVLFRDIIGFVEKHKKEKLDENIKSRKTKVRKTYMVVRVKSIEYIGEEDVYDCTVPEVSCFDANGIMVHNCCEQSLGDAETCCLAELYLPNIKTKDELFKCAKYLYRICKHSLALSCPDSQKTENIVHKNFRMGISCTGYLMATEEQRCWLSDCYEFLREFDKKYSLIHGFPISVKICTTKPSGTLSLLAGVTSGVHPAYSQYYIRRIRIASESPLVDVVKKHGYHIEYVKNFDGTDDHRTMVISFPYSLPIGTILAENCSAIQQLEYVKRMQTEWSDNSVSVTVTYKKEELPEIKEWLRKNYNNSIKTVSFLLHSDHGFVQAPIEPITKEKYDEMVATTRPITDMTGICFSKEDEQFIGEGECQGGICPIR